MSAAASNWTGAAWICPGLVVHHRLRPKPHTLRYRVFSIMLDLDHLDTVASHWFSHNRFNLLSFHDTDHLSGKGSALDEAKAMLTGAGFALDGGRILLLTYPRLFGFVFNPLSVFLCYDREGALQALIYEVNNTFGERKCYVLPAGEAQDGIHAQTCAKELYVSPFTASAGRYGFRIRAAPDELLVAVNFRDGNGPLLRTHFAGVAQPLTDKTALRAALSQPLMTLKVVAGINYEAAKLWLKGVPLVRRHKSPVYSVTVGDTRQTRRTITADSVPSRGGTKLVNGRPHD